MGKILRLFLFLSIFIFWFWKTYWNLDIKMSDCISPFFDDNKTINHYSSIPFNQLDLDTKDLVNKNQLQESKIRFEKYVKILKENWYNSISLDDLNHLLLFEKSSIYKWTRVEKRNKIYLLYYKDLVKIAKKNDLDVYIVSDMQFYTEALLSYTWQLKSDNKKLLEINKEAFEDIFTNLEDISGIILRIWEWWKTYNSWDYKSKVIYKKPEDINLLLSEILPIFEKYNKKLIFRTWTIWIGEIWDLIINKDTYDKVFSWIKSDNLIVSIKHTPGDFFWFENLNPTIWYGNLKQIVEIQIRREYEWWWDFPNYIWDYYKSIYEEISKKENVVWVWNWNQTGGWWWWKNILFNFWFNFWNEINFYSVWSFLKTWEIDLDKILDKYSFNDNEKESLKEILLNSRNVIKKWWYINNFRQKQLLVWWIYMPPLSWIWWDRLTSSPVILSIIYNLLDKKLDTIEESSYLLWVQEKEIELWRKSSRGNDLNNHILFSLQNRYMIFDVLHTFKKAIIIYFQTWNKDYYDEIDSKIKTYYDFVWNKTYLKFNFDEVYAFYSVKTDNLYFYINLLFFFILLVFIYRYTSLKKFYKKKHLNKVFVLSWFWLIVWALTISPFFFLSQYNFYWIFVKINYIVMPLIIIYFLIINKLIYKLYSIKIKLKRTFGRLIYSLSPVLIWLEVVIIISHLFWEQFFWNLLAMWVIENDIRVIIIIAFTLYFIAFIWYWFYFSNISKFLTKLSHKKVVYSFSFVFLFVFLFIVYSLDHKKIFTKSITNNILPSYFQSAGTDVWEFF